MTHDEEQVANVLAAADLRLGPHSPAGEAYDVFLSIVRDKEMKHDDLEQVAYLRGWNDRPAGDMWSGIIIGLIVGMVLAWLIGVVA